MESKSIVIPPTVLPVFGIPIPFQTHGATISPDNDHPVYSPNYLFGGLGVKHSTSLFLILPPIKA